jgi:hypothetical protein
MSSSTLKASLIALLLIWLFVFSIDSIFGIDWPSYTLQRVFIWTPTVIIAVYWMAFGGSKKKEK